MRSSVLVTAKVEFPHPGSQANGARVDAESVVEQPDPVVLIVDDDPVICDVLTVILEDEGLEAHAVYRGEDALEWAKDHSPQAIILDLMMPGIDGWETCRRLKDDPRTTRIPVIVLTARVTERDRNLSLWAGAESFFTKPVETENLVGAVKRTIESTVKPPPPRPDR
jgi:CheY-like chemotaxis protein